MSDETPADKALLPLSETNAAWLHALAERAFDGDIPLALDASLNYLREILEPPADPWAALTKFGRRRPS